MVQRPHLTQVGAEYLREGLRGEICCPLPLPILHTQGFPMKTRAVKPVFHLHDESSDSSEDWYLFGVGSSQLQTLRADFRWKKVIP